MRRQPLILLVQHFQRPIDHFIRTLISAGAQEATVVDTANHPVGRLSLTRVLAQGAHHPAPRA